MGTSGSQMLLLKFKCFINPINILFQMDTEGGGTDGGEFGEETELNILQGFDFDQNQDATWLLTSPTNSPRAGTLYKCSQLLLQNS